MRLGLLSDTHIPEVAKELPLEVREAFRGVDLILHAGDIYIPSVLDELECIAPVLAARGDDDYASTLMDKRVKDKHILRLEGRTLWLVHQRPYVYTWGQGKPPTGQDNSPDIIVFGHEHQTIVQQAYDVLFVNPGSPTFLHYIRGLGTVGILDINSGKVEAHILQL